MDDALHPNGDLFVFGLDTSARQRPKPCACSLCDSNDTKFCVEFFIFYFKTIGFALAEIIVLWGSIVLMIVLFYRVKPISAFLNVPYLFWVSFATVLNAAYFLLN